PGIDARPAATRDAADRGTGSAGAAEGPAMTKIPARHGKPAKNQATVSIEAELHELLRTAAFELRRSQSGIFIEALQMWLSMKYEKENRGETPGGPRRTSKAQA